MKNKIKIEYILVQVPSSTIIVDTCPIEFLYEQTISFLGLPLLFLPNFAPT